MFLKLFCLQSLLNHFLILSQICVSSCNVILSVVGSHGYVECHCQIIEEISEDIVSGLGTRHRWWQPGTPLSEMPHEQL